MVEELLKKIPPEKCWAITAKILCDILVVQGEKITAPLLGKGEDIFAPVMGAETWTEINVKIFGGAFKQFFQWVKDTFNIPVEDAIGASNLIYVAATLQSGPEWDYEYPEATRERVVGRWTKCAWWERYTENEVRPEFIPCLPTCEVEVAGKA